MIIKCIWYNERGIFFGVSRMFKVDMAPTEELDLYIKWILDPGISMDSLAMLSSGIIPPGGFVGIWADDIDGLCGEFMTGFMLS